MSKQRYEREIEEILRKYDEESGRKDRVPTREAKETRPPVDLKYTLPGSSRVPQSGGFTMPNWKRLSAGQYILMAFGSAIMAVLLRGLWEPLTFLFIILAAVLFLVPILLYANTSTSSGGYSPTEQKRWRGQVIDINTRRDLTNDPLAGIKRWFKKR